MQKYWNNTHHHSYKGAGDGVKEILKETHRYISCNWQQQMRRKGRTDKCHSSMNYSDWATLWPQAGERRERTNAKKDQVELRVCVCVCGTLEMYMIVLILYFFSRFFCFCFVFFFNLTLRLNKPLSLSITLLLLLSRQRYKDWYRYQWIDVRLCMYVFFYMYICMYVCSI